MEKEEIRKHIRNIRRQFDSQTLDELSSVICSKVLSNHKVITAKTILLYHSLADEVKTIDLLSVLHNNGKRVLLPKITGDCEMDIRLYEGEERLLQGKYSIMEPMGNSFTHYDSIDVAIVPGMAFDKTCHRLGRGKGYYDRLLSQLTNAYKIGICFGFQFLNDIPVTVNDINVDEVITELSI